MTEKDWQRFWDWLINLSEAKSYSIYHMDRETHMDVAVWLEERRKEYFYQSSNQTANEVKE